MRRLIQILSVSVLLTLASAARGQTPPTCGVVDIEGPTEVEPNTPLVFKVKVTGMIHTTKPQFSWSASAGTITMGQGTDEVTIDTVGLGGQVVTVTAELAGAPRGCQGTASKTANVAVQPVVCGRAFDQYGDIRFDDEKARLDNFAISITNEPLLIGYILMSAGQKTFENEAAERLDRAKKYIVEVREIDPNRIVTLDCGFSEDLRVTLYMFPATAITIPTCDIFTTIPLSEVKFTKPRPKSSKKRR